MRYYITILIICCFYNNIIGQTRFHEDAEKVFDQVTVLISQNKLEQAEGLLLPIKARLRSKSISRDIWDYITYTSLVGHELHLAVLRENYIKAIEICKKAQEKIKPGIRIDDQMAVGYYSQCLNEQLYSQIAEDFSLESLRSAKLNLKALEGKAKSQRFHLPSTKKIVLNMLNLQMNQIDVKLKEFQE